MINLNQQNNLYASYEETIDEKIDHFLSFFFNDSTLDPSIKDLTTNNCLEVISADSCNSVFNSMIGDTQCSNDNNNNYYYNDNNKDEEDDEINSTTDKYHYNIPPYENPLHNFSVDPSMDHLQNKDDATNLNQNNNKKRDRINFTYIQLRILEIMFHKSTYLSKSQRNTLALQLQLTEKQVTRFFVLKL